MKDWLTLAELSELSEVPARTIRFYIARGLLDGPSKAGRGAAYSKAHLNGLERIKALQNQGRTLSEIAHEMAGPDLGTRVAPPAPWWQHIIADDLIVLTRADAQPWRTKQIRAALDDLARRLQPGGNPKGADSDS